jgi:DNA-binding transcriptional regulator YiaG
VRSPLEVTQRERAAQHAALLVKIIRKREGLSQRRLARLLGVSRRAVVRWNLGQSPPIGGAKRLLELLELRPELLGLLEHLADAQDRRRPAPVPDLYARVVGLCAY